jgi:hypothetical protein
MRTAEAEISGRIGEATEQFVAALRDAARLLEGGDLDG